MGDRIEKLARKEIVELQPYVCARDICKEADIFMDANENPYGRGQLNRYPDSDQLELRRALAGYVGNGVTWRNVIAGNGSDEIIDLAIRVFADKGDSIVCTPPDYSMYRVQAAINGVKVKDVPLAGDFSLDVDAIIRSCGPRTKMVFFSSPNSPTGKARPIEDIERLARSVRAIVFVDETYSEFSGETAARLVNELPNLVISRTFSKAWGLAGIRVGYLIAPENVIELMRKVKQPYNVSRTSGNMALRALAREKGRMRENVRKLRAERKRLAARFEEMGFEVFPSVTNFFLCRSPPWLDASELQRKLAARGIVLRDFSQRPMLNNCLRVTVGKPSENDRLLRELRKLCRPDFDAIFMDIDGTLVDVSRSYIESIRIAAERISGRKVSRSLVNEVKEMPTMNDDWDSTMEVLRRMGVRSSKRQVVPVFQDIYLGKNGDGLVRNEKPIVEVGLLKRSRKKIVLVTGRSRAESKIAMRMLGLSDDFPLVAMEDTPKKKPDPASLLLAMKIFGAERPVYVGDSSGDREAAANAGLAFVAIGKGKKQKGEFARFRNADEALRRLSV